MQSGIENFIPLESLQVASPCRADWNAMRGDDQTRFCQSCEKHVYNLSGMTRAEAERLIHAREGSVCIRLFRRPDGTVITDDCPVGLRRVRNASRYAGRLVLRPVRWTAAKVAMLLAPALLVGGTALAKAGGGSVCNAFTRSVKNTWLFQRLSGTDNYGVMGDIAPAPFPPGPLAPAPPSPSPTPPPQ